MTEPLDLSREVKVLDLHPELIDAADVARLNARGVRTICYVSVGTLEKTASDRHLFPSEVVGKVYEAWPDERFLDIRRLDVLVPLMKARFDEVQGAWLRSPSSRTIWTSIRTIQDFR